MNNNNGIVKNDSDWLTALDFVKDVKGSPKHLTFHIYQKMPSYTTLEVTGFCISSLMAIFARFQQIPSSDSVIFWPLVKNINKWAIFNLIKNGIFANCLIKIIIIAQTCQKQ